MFMKVKEIEDLTLVDYIHISWMDTDEEIHDNEIGEKDPSDGKVNDESDNKEISDLYSLKHIGLNRVSRFKYNPEESPKEPKQPRQEEAYKEIAENQDMESLGVINAQEELS